MRLMTKKEMKQFLKEVNKRKKFREALLQLVKNRSMNTPVNFELAKLLKEKGFEVIDHTSELQGRILVKYGVKVEISIQDDGRTMKVFLTDKINNNQKKYIKHTE